MTRVSIAMATYNGERFLREQLDSIAAQTRPPDELVICDDCSSDRTVAIAEEFAAAAPFPVRIERNAETLGYSQNFDRAMGRYDGDVIFIADQDDAWDEDKIAVVLAAMDAAGRPIVTVNDQRIADADGRMTGRTIFQNSRSLGWSSERLIAGSCTALPRALLDLVLPVPLGVAYDHWIGAIADSLAIKRLIERPLQLFRRHGSNSSDPFMVSEAPGRLTEFKRFGFSDPRLGWKAEREWRGELVERLAGASDALVEAIGIDAIAHAIRTNRAKIDALQGREGIIGHPRWQRGPEVFKGLRSGVYRSFGGARSALKDLFRP